MSLRAALTVLKRRAPADLALFGGLGLLMAFIGPYGTALAPASDRIVYWLTPILAGGALGASVDAGLEARLPGSLSRTLVVSAIITAPIAILVLALGLALLPAPSRPHPGPGFLLEVAAIVILVMGVRALARRRPIVRVETQTVIEAPLPEAEAQFRLRLSARRRGARLIAVEADDHYLKVHTDAGVELISARFADALEDLKGAAGLQIHRSWWVANDSILEVRWRRGAGTARLIGDVTAPVSRSNAAKLRTLGWR